jgi:hypothetical protein
VKEKVHEAPVVESIPKATFLYEEKGSKDKEEASTSAPGGPRGGYQHTREGEAEKPNPP